MKVYVWRSDMAPAADRWQAAAQEYDLDVPAGSGATVMEAIEDLLWHLDDETTDPEKVDIIWEDD